MKILITGSCGFIGFNLSKFLLKKKIKIIGIDNLNNYYDVNLKKKRLKILKRDKNFKFYKLDLANENKVTSVFNDNKFNCVINLAAQAGVRYSIKYPKKYIHSNIVGFHNILENCRLKSIKKIIIASSSSVYGDKKSFPLKETEIINPKNFYGLTKKNNEEMSAIYSKLYGMNICALRFFTVYGEWGRPDMFMLKYIKSKKKFYLYNHGSHFRDFTYIQDVNEIIFRLIKKKNNGFSLFNVSSNQPYKITKIIDIINKFLKKPKLKIIKLGLQKADVIKTHGSNKKITQFLKFKKFTPIEIGVKNLIDWYKKNY